MRVAGVVRPVADLTHLLVQEQDTDHAPGVQGTPGCSFINSQTGDIQGRVARGGCWCSFVELGLHSCAGTILTDCCLGLLALFPHAAIGPAVG
jgi:hypothetical protein